MTSRERVAKTVNRQKADRTPIDLGGMKASGITASACHRVKQQLGIQALSIANQQPQSLLTLFR